MARLRVKNADLNENLYNRNLTPSPLCTVLQAVRQQSIFYYVAQSMKKRIMLEGIETMIRTAADLLIGIEGECQETNTRITRKTIKYLQSTKRFKN